MIQGSTYVLKGLKLLFSRGYRKYVIMPLTINLAVFSSLYWFGMRWFWKLFHDSGIHLPSWLSWLEPFMGYLGPIVFWLSFIILGVALLLTLGSISSIIASILASPFNSFLVEKILSQHKPIKPAPFFRVLKEAIIRELQKICFYLPRFVLVFVIFALFYFIPILNIVGSALFFMFSAWMLSFEYLDYCAETEHMSVKDYKHWLKTHRRLTYPFGLMNMFLASIPVLNLIAMPAGVAGGALLWVDQTAAQS